MGQVIITPAGKPSQPAGALATARVGDWWLYKFSPILATFYATVGLAGGPLLPLLGRLLVLLLSLVVGAVYVSIVNDWTDRADDAAGGKANRLAGRSPRFIGLALGSCLLAGGGFGWYFWQLDQLSALLYLGAWVVYSLYSLPPARLKGRGLAGVLADAAGAHFFPLLLTVALAGRWTGQAVPAAWWAAMGAWALAGGIRNILWHQLADADADAQAGVGTFVRRRGQRLAQRLGQALAFPVEIGAFGMVLLLLSQPAWAVAMLGLYGGLEWCRWRIWGYRPAVLAPDSRLVLNDYYQFFFPLALLLGQARRYPADGLVLVLHAGLFWPSVQQLGQEAGQYAALARRKATSRQAG
ncbi:MAG: hypothetical protein EOO59_00765 [Hymenobacter sp.]|nr:MAG: hypothetical protein EOO59_00765 [Hymenobacter sp.]